MNEVMRDPTAVVSRSCQSSSSHGVACTESTVGTVANVTDPSQGASGAVTSMQ